MRHFGKLIAAVWLGLAAPASAGDNLVVVELFTSQGCSSCPPADALLGEIAERSDILPLALHVDYWDYIGWKDEFADPRNTQRQKDYARVNNKRSVYTPQMIVGGVDFVVGYKPMKVADLMQAHAAAAPRADIDLTRRGNTLEIAVSGVARRADLVVQVVSYDPKRSVRISRGENAGRTLDYHNIVTSWTRVGDWNGAGTFRTTVQVATDQPLAVIVQEDGPGRVYAASRAP